MTGTGRDADPIRSSHINPERGHRARRGLLSARVR